MIRVRPRLWIGLKSELFKTPTLPELRYAQEGDRYFAKDTTEYYIFSDNQWKLITGGGGGITDCNDILNCIYIETTEQIGNETYKVLYQKTPHRNLIISTKKVS